MAVIDAGVSSSGASLNPPMLARSLPTQRLVLRQAGGALGGVQGVAGD